MEFDALSGKVIGCAIEVHRHLGPGLLESAYQNCLLFELHHEGIQAEKELQLPVKYKGVDLDCGYRIDILVEKKIVVELKCVEELSGIHSAQILTYMKLGKYPVGLLLNFHVERLKDGGIKRFVL